MIKQEEQLAQAVLPYINEAQDAEVQGINLRRQVWEETLGAFVERFDFTPVEIKPDIHEGVPLVAGSDMPLSTILWMLSVGYRMENLLKEYPGLERKQLLNALAFAADLLDG